MISQKKLEANRSNAQKSTGPTSDEGKAIASRNSLKHGLYSSNPLLHDENPTEYEAFRAGLLDSLKPADALQQVLADRVIALAWKLQRTGDIEDAVIRYFHDDWNSDRNTQTAVERIADFFARTDDALQLDHVSRYEQRLQRSMQAAIRQLMQLQKQARENQQEPDAPDDAQNIRNEPTVRQSSRQADAANPQSVQEKAESADSCPKPSTIGHLPQDRQAIGGDMAVDGRYNLTPERLLCSPGVKPSARLAVLEDKESPL